MLKTFTLFAILASAFASPHLHWAGSWFVAAAAHTYNNISCDFPAWLTVVNITTTPNNTLSLAGFATLAQESKKWSLDWNTNDLNASIDLGNNWVLNGTLVIKEGAKYALLEWYDSNTSDTSTYCEATMIPLVTKWTGEWFVVSSLGDENCSVPLTSDVVKIVQNGYQLVMTGKDDNTWLKSNWTLNFTENELHVKNACLDSDGTCVDANMGIKNYYLTGNLTWFTSDGDSCATNLISFPNVVGASSEVMFEEDGMSLLDSIDVKLKRSEERVQDIIA